MPVVAVSVVPAASVVALDGGGGGGGGSGGGDAGVGVAAIHSTSVSIRLTPEATPKLTLWEKPVRSAQVALSRCLTRPRRRKLACSSVSPSSSDTSM